MSEEKQGEQGSGAENPEQVEGTTAHQVEQAEGDADEAKQTMKELEEQDEPPAKLEDWPDGEAKYETFGGPEGEHSYDEGPERKLGPSSLRHGEDGSVKIEGEEVDDPDEFKGDPIPGGPTDPNTPAAAGEKEGDDAKRQREEGDSGGDED
jgi:hypothetical protein